MREIKFRAWHARHKHAAPQMLYDEKPGDCLLWQSQGQNITQVMQYTGLNDKNGKEIYEGDIVRWFDRTTDWYRNPEKNNGYILTESIIFKNGSFRTTKYEELLINLVGTERWNALEKSEIQVIGNIYENPELLEATP